MPVPRLASASLSLLLAVCGLAVAGCGGGHHSSKPQLLGTAVTAGGQRAYKVRLPNGRVVTQAHSPALAQPSRKLTLPRPQTGVATVEQYDSITISTIPAGARYVAGYVDGAWPTYWQLRGRWPVVVGISVATVHGADCFDMEPGNPGPQSAGPWAKWQLTQGNARPCEYSMLSWMPAIRANLAAYKIPVCTATQTRCVRLWDANWTYMPRLDAGYACTQWTDHALSRNLDESTCAAWFYSTPTPPKPTPPKPAPKPVVDPYHYRTLTRYERGLVLHYDGARKHPAKYKAWLRTLQGELAADAHQVWVAAHRAPPKPVSWGYRNRGVRFGAVYRRSLGKQVVK